MLYDFLLSLHLYVAFSKTLWHLAEAKIKAWIFFFPFSFIKGKGLCRYEAVGIKRSR